MDRRRFIAPSGLTAMAAGAALMFFLDPDSGRRRRALARDKYLHGKTALQDATESAVHRAADQTRGAIARIQNRIASRPEGTVDLPVEDPTSGSLPS